MAWFAWVARIMWSKPDIDDGPEGLEKEMEDVKRLEKSWDIEWIVEERWRREGGRDFVIRRTASATPSFTT